MGTMWQKQRTTRGYYGNSVRMSVKTLTPLRNDKWEQCDTKHKTHKIIQQEKKYSPAHVPVSVIIFWNHISGECGAGYCYLHLKLDIVYFQIYPKQIPFQFSVGTQYYFLFIGNGKQTMILLKTLAGPWAGGAESGRYFLPSNKFCSALCFVSHCSCCHFLLCFCVIVFPMIPPWFLWESSLTA